MIERIAVKILSGSDLTFFDAMFKKLDFGNQKSINLNADICIHRLYPGLEARARGEDVEIPVSVTVFGPAKAGAYRFPRSITRKEAYRNWRLNGAAVPDPDGEPGRFGNLGIGDVAVFEFTGDPESPSGEFMRDCRAFSA